MIRQTKIFWELIMERTFNKNSLLHTSAMLVSFWRQHMMLTSAELKPTEKYNNSHKITLLLCVCIYQCTYIYMQCIIVVQDWTTFSFQINTVSNAGSHVALSQILHLSRVLSESRVSSILFYHFKIILRNLLLNEINYKVSDILEREERLISS